MDVKVYKKETVKQPSGETEVYVPDVIDIIPELIEVESSSDVKSNIWTLEKLKRIADVEVINGKLIIKSDKVRYEDGNLYVTITEEQISNAVTLDSDRDELEQACALATIWQRGLDPLDLEDGVQWSEAILEEIPTALLMEQITNAVKNVSLSASVSFDVIEIDNGQTVLTYDLRMVS